MRAPLVVHWPSRIARGGAVRTQFCHAVDLFPTVLAATGVARPAQVDGVAQRALDGASLLGCIDDAAAPAPRDTQYFEMVGSRSLYHAGWKVTTDHVGNQVPAERALVAGSHDFATDRWSLFHLDGDFSEAHDRADAEPERLRALVDLWWAEAGRNQVLPLEDGFLSRAGAMVRPPFGFRRTVELVRGRRSRRGGRAAAAVRRLRARRGARAPVARPAEGVIAALGDWTNGWALYLLGGRPVAVFNVCGDVHRLAPDEVVGAGAHELRLEYVRSASGGGKAVLELDGRALAELELARDLPFRWQIGGAGLSIGRDRGFPVCDDYTPPFPFTGDAPPRGVGRGARRPARSRRRRSRPRCAASEPWRCFASDTSASASRTSPRALAFYCDLLGFRPLTETVVADALSAKLLGLPEVDQTTVFVERDGVRLALFAFRKPGTLRAPVPRPMNQTGMAALMLRVDDLDATVAKIRAAGFPVLDDTRIEHPAYGLEAALRHATATAR